MPDQSSSQRSPMPNSLRGDIRSADGIAAGYQAALELDCRSFELQVQELLDQRKDPTCDAAVQIHASQCAECSELLEQFTQLESTLQLALKAKIPATRDSRATPRPLHPVSQRQREQLSWVAQAASVLLICGTVIGWMASRPTQQTSLLPVAVSNESSRNLREPALASVSGIRPAVHYRSLEQCYELTSELPGVRPLQSSIQVAIAWWWDYLNLDGNDTRSLPHHERGFGLNPLMAEANRQV